MVTPDTHTLVRPTLIERTIMSYSHDLRHPQATDKSRPDMIEGRGGGFGFQISDQERLERFLILGHEGGTYYANQRTLTYETVEILDRMMDFDPELLVEMIVEISESGRAPKNDAAIFALAYVVSKSGSIGAEHAMRAIHKVCRIGTHLFDFLEHCKNMGRGWGSAFKRGVGMYYDRNPRALAMQVTKYAQRNGWSQRDVLRKCHFKTDNAELNQVLQYVTQNAQWARSWARSLTNTGDTYRLLEGVYTVQHADLTPAQVASWIRDRGLVREHLPTHYLNHPEVWEALLENMPMTAMIRNLGKMSHIGLLRPMANATRQVVSSLQDTESLRRQRVHPVAILLAHKVYSQGHGVRGSLRWTPDQQIIAALDNAFYAAFDNVEPTGKRLVLGVDCSGSMGMHRNRCVGAELLSSREAAAVMAMLAVKTETQTYIHGFSTSFIDLGITPNDSLQTVVEKTRNVPFARTNCAVPMQFAQNNNIEADAFCIYTDNETNYGEHPYAALQNYRQASGIPAKLAVFGFANSDFSVADPNDSGMMDFVGFDAAAPVLLSNFLR